MKFVVTAGPTREPLDPVRFLSNRSSGKMGYALAEAAREKKLEVTLISGPVCLEPPTDMRMIRIMTGDELAEEVHREAADADVLLMCAAVADYKPVTVSARKNEKLDGEIQLALVRTRDILATLPNESRRCFVVGFAAQTHDLEACARRKLIEKNCDMIIANDVSRADVGIDSDENEVLILSRDGEKFELARASKKILAEKIIEIILQVRQKSLTINS